MSMSFKNSPEKLSKLGITITEKRKTTKINVGSDSHSRERDSKLTCRLFVMRGT